MAARQQAQRIAWRVVCEAHRAPTLKTRAISPVPTATPRAPYAAARVSWGAWYPGACYQHTAGLVARALLLLALTGEGLGQRVDGLG